MTLNIWNIATGEAFLAVLADALIAGYPLDDTDREKPLLAQWTVLVPTRRAARLLEDMLYQRSKQGAMLLPRIKPIGDIDEELIQDSFPALGVPDAISKAGQLSLLLTLVMQWADENPQLQLAADIRASGAQTYHLALSLQELLNQIETEEAGFEKLPVVYEQDHAEHRSAILSLLDVIAKRLPKYLHDANLIGPAARRNLMIRLEAERILSGKHRGPIVVAGSTGTNPATRALLHAVALQPEGAVILPGLDTTLDDAAWDAITPEHPQFALKTMLTEWRVHRGDVATLGVTSNRRQVLMGLALRPADAAEGWRDAIAGVPNAALGLWTDVELLEAADHRQEARCIALCLRQHVMTGGARAALITPDRTLARNVKIELARWNMAIDDSAGEPLAEHGLASLLVLLLQAIAARFAAPQLLALLHHPACTLGVPRATFIVQLRQLEITCLRGFPESTDLLKLPGVCKAAREAAQTASHLHPLVRRLTNADWQEVSLLIDKLIGALGEFLVDPSATLEQHITALSSALKALAPDVDEDDEVRQRLIEVLEGLTRESRWHPDATLAWSQHVILHMLKTETLRPVQQQDSTLAIYGLLEARLMPLDLAVLGGLIEGVWPAAQQSGPWLNRSMRQGFGLQQPERDIGLTAHDFVQGFGQPRVVLTWSKRAAGEPQIPSRWILRLLAVAQTLAMPREVMISPTLPRLAIALDFAEKFSPQQKPMPTPPPKIRPHAFSVTEIEKLVRDSYSIYAKKILKLEPLDDIHGSLDAALRGSLLHAALHNWTKGKPSDIKADALQSLLTKGREVFAPYMHMPEVNRFWWMRFKRMAETLVNLDGYSPADVVAAFSEVNGKLLLPLGLVTFTLKARADRIDVMADRSIRIIDYKSGGSPTPKEVQSGFAPQLTLEAAMAARSAFLPQLPITVTDLVYIGISGGPEAASIKSLGENFDVKAEAELQFEKLLALLQRYQDASTAYIPRHNLQKDNDRSDFDHLSRRREWELAGDAAP